MGEAERYLEGLKSIFPILRKSGHAPHNHLYHYTSPDVLLRILNTEGKCGFCCTHYKFLNDDEEFACGIGLVLDWVCEQNKTARWDIPEFAVRVDSLAETISAAIEKEYASWVMSLSFEMDSVSQWASYTDHAKGGFAIGVKWRDLIEGVASLDGVLEHFRCEEKFGTVWFVAPCVYVQKAKLHNPRNLLNDESRKTAYACLDAIFQTCGGVGLFRSKRAIANLAKLAILFASFVKNGEFEHEREWRVVALTDDGLDFNDVEFIGGKPRIRLPVKSAVDLIGKLVVSHHGDRERLKLTADILRKKYGDRFYVRESKTSYVG